jgi:hypothetical protein
MWYNYILNYGLSSNLINIQIKEIKLGNYQVIYMCVIGNGAFYCVEYVLVILLLIQW